MNEVNIYKLLQKGEENADVEKKLNKPRETMKNLKPKRKCSDDPCFGKCKELKQRAKPRPVHRESKIKT